MIYLINRNTKEHIIWDCKSYPADSELYLVETDEAGWIKWTGKNECPLPTGQLHEVMFRNGGNHRTNRPHSWNWSFSSYPHSYDIVAYRPIFDDSESIAKDAGMTVQEAYENQHRRFYTETNDTIPRLLIELKSAQEVAQRIPDILNKLYKTLGPDLVEMLIAKHNEELSVESDMSDWRNWQEGDFVTRIEWRPAYKWWKPNHPYEIVKRSNTLVVIADDGDIYPLEKHMSSEQIFGFHSRPKGKK